MLILCTFYPPDPLSPLTIPACIVVKPISTPAGVNAEHTYLFIRDDPWWRGAGGGACGAARGGRGAGRVGAWASR